MTYLNPKAICKKCGHYRKDHSEFEWSIGNDGHVCEKRIRRKKAVFKCTCRRFEE